MLFWWLTWSNYNSTCFPRDVSSVLTIANISKRRIGTEPGMKRWQERASWSCRPRPGVEKMRQDETRWDKSDVTFPSGNPPKNDKSEKMNEKSSQMQKLEASMQKDRNKSRSRAAIFVAADRQVYFPSILAQLVLVAHSTPTCIPCNVVNNPMLAITCRFHSTSPSPQIIS